MEQRLQKLLASAGIASRRACEELIAQGKVTVNGVVVSEPGQKADSHTDDVRVNGKSIPKSVDRVYLLLNKPIGFVTTVKDPHAERTVMSLVKSVTERVYPVGRLDADSAGLLILSNDGDFTKLLTHPSHQVPKTYRAVVRGRVLPKTVRELSNGIALHDGITAPADVEVVDYDSANNASILDITLREGKNRQVRRMCLAVHHPVLALTRTRIGPIHLRGLPPGKWRKLHPAEVNQLKELAESMRPETAARLPRPTTDAGRSSKPRQKRGTESRISSAKRAVNMSESTDSARQAAVEITRKLRAPQSRNTQAMGRRKRGSPVEKRRA